MEPINNSNIDERLTALTINLQLLSPDREPDKEKMRTLFLLAEDVLKTSQAQGASIQDLLKAVAQDAENIRMLPRIAENHERPLSDMERPSS